MITDVDIKKMKAVFATKDDLKSFATKDDLKSIKDSLKAFATKEDLKSFASKDDLKVFATKKYVDKRFERLFKYLDHRFEPLDELVNSFNDFKNKAFINLDWLTGKYKKFEEEHTVLTEQNSRNINKLDNHEKRIFNLEQRMVTS